MMLGQTDGIPLGDVTTPCLVLDPERMARNVARLRHRLEALGVPLRPHLKTVKSAEVARLVMADPAGPAAVSTLDEAERFGDAGVRDILYAVGVSPDKLGRVAGLRAKGIDLVVVVDSEEAASAVAAASRETGDPIPTLVEIDSDGHRAGVAPEEMAQVVVIGRRLHEGGAQLRGIMTHAGESYSCRETAAIEAMAETERRAAVRCAKALRAAGLPCPVVSVGSTPTAHFVRNLAGVTEVRAGVFPFFDLFMVGLGVCRRDDIALSVLATVIGHQRRKGWIIVDAGWMALSRDRGTANQAVDQRYGLVCDLAGRHYPDLMLVDTHQEHGVMAIRRGSAAELPPLALGDRVRILPNHACATGAQHDSYLVVEPGADHARARWPRFRGW